MNKGAVVERGSIDQIFTRPQHPYTRGLLAASDLSATDDQGKLFTVATAANYRPGHAVSRMTAAAPEVSGDVVKVENLTRVYKSPRTSLFTAPREVKGAERRLVLDRRGRPVRHRRRVGLGQVDAAAPAVGPRPAHLG